MLSNSEIYRRAPRPHVVLQRVKACIEQGKHWLLRSALETHATYSSGRNIDERTVPLR